MRFILAFLSLAFYTTSYAQEPELVLPVGHPQGLTGAKFSRNGKYVISKSYNDDNIKLWDIRTGRLLANFAMPGGVRGMELANDSRTLIGIDEYSVNTWDIISRKQNAHFDTDSTGLISNAGFLLRSNQFYVAYDSTLVLLDSTGKQFSKVNFNAPIGTVLTTGNPVEMLITTTDTAGISSLFRYNIINGASQSLIASQPFKSFYDDEFLTCITKKGKGLIYSRAAHRLLRSFPVDKWDFENLVAGDVADKGDKVLFSYSDSSVWLYNTITGKMIESFGYPATVQELAFVHNDQQYVLIDSRGWADMFTTAGGGHVHAFYPDTSNRVFRTVAPFIATSADKKQMMIPLSDNILRIWTLGRKPQLFQSLSGKTTGVSVRSASKVSPHVALGNHAGEIRVFNITTGRHDLVIETGHSDIRDLSFSDDGKLIVGVMDTVTKIWSFPEGKLLQALPEDNEVYTARLSLDNQYIVTSIGYTAGQKTDTALRIWDWRAGKLRAALPSDKRFHLLNADFAYGDSMLLCTNPGDSTVFLLDANTFRQKWTYRANEWLFNAQQMGDKPLIALLTLSSIDMIDVNTGQLVKRFPIRNELDFGTFAYNSKQEVLVTGGDDGVIATWNMNTGEKLYSVAAHKAGTVPLLYNDSLVLSVSEDGTFRAWSFPALQPVYQVVPLLKNESLVALPDGFYSGTKNAAKDLHYVTPDLGIVTFEQLDARYNRPDKVMQALNPSDTFMIANYRNAYYKRLRKMHLDTVAVAGTLSVPVAEISNREKLSYNQASKTITLNVRGHDKIYPLERFNIWVNEVPLFGADGLSLTRGSKEFDTTITIVLSEGINHIETSMRNERGVESYRRPLVLNFQPPVNVPARMYFIGIGINEFADKSNNLRWSVKDIRDLAKKLKTRYRNIIIDTLFDKKVTRKNILALKHRLQQAGEDDKVIVSYSGHGLLSKDLDYYLSTYHVDFTNPESGGVSYEELESLLDGIRPRKKLLMIDACHSGEVDKEEMERIITVSKNFDSTGVKADTANRSTIKVKKKAGVANSFELMQNMFLNVSRGTGATVISAAGGMQYAQERGDLKNGVFTYSIINAFNTNKELTVSQLKKIVSESVIRLTRGLQQPTSRSETMQSDWRVW